MNPVSKKKVIITQNGVIAAAVSGVNSVVGGATGGSVNANAPSAILRLHGDTKATSSAAASLESQNAIAEIVTPAQVVNDESEVELTSEEELELQAKEELRKLQLHRLILNKDALMEKIRVLCQESGELIARSMFQESNFFLEQAEEIIEYAANRGKSINRNLIITVLYNRACSYQGLWKLDKCNKYIDAVIFNIETSLQHETWPPMSTPPLERVAYKIKRQTFLVKCYLQQCAILSQLVKHQKAIETAKKAIRVLEDVQSSMLRISQEKLSSSSSNLNIKQNGSSLKTPQDTQIQSSTSLGGSAGNASSTTTSAVAITTIQQAIAYLQIIEKRDAFNVLGNDTNCNQLKKSRKQISKWKSSPMNSNGNANESNKKVQGSSSSSNSNGNNSNTVAAGQEWIEQFNIGSIMHMTCIDFEEFSRFDDFIVYLTPKHLIENDDDDDDESEEDAEVEKISKEVGNFDNYDEDLSGYQSSKLSDRTNGEVEKVTNISGNSGVRGGAAGVHGTVESTNSNGIGGNLSAAAASTSPGRVGIHSNASVNLSSSLGRTNLQAAAASGNSSDANKLILQQQQQQSLVQAQQQRKRSPVAGNEGTTDRQRGGSPSTSGLEKSQAAGSENTAQNLGNIQAIKVAKNTPFFMKKPQQLDLDTVNSATQSLGGSANGNSNVSQSRNATVSMQSMSSSSTTPNNLTRKSSPSHYDESTRRLAMRSKENDRAAAAITSSAGSPSPHSPGSSQQQQSQQQQQQQQQLSSTNNINNNSNQMQVLRTFSQQNLSPRGGQTTAGNSSIKTIFQSKYSNMQSPQQLQSGQQQPSSPRTQSSPIQSASMIGLNSSSSQSMVQMSQSPLGSNSLSTSQLQQSMLNNQSNSSVNNNNSNASSIAKAKQLANAALTMTSSAQNFHSSNNNNNNNQQLQLSLSSTGGAANASAVGAKKPVQQQWVSTTGANSSSDGSGGGEKYSPRGNYSMPGAGGIKVEVAQQQSQQQQTIKVGSSMKQSGSSRNIPAPSNLNNSSGSAATSGSSLSQSANGSSKTTSTTMTSSSSVGLQAGGGGDVSQQRQQHSLSSVSAQPLSQMQMKASNSQGFTVQQQMAMNPTGQQSINSTVPLKGTAMVVNLKDFSPKNSQQQQQQHSFLNQIDVMNSSSGSNSGGMKNVVPAAANAANNNNGKDVRMGSANGASKNVPRLDLNSVGNNGSNGQINGVAGRNEDGSAANSFRYFSARDNSTAAGSAAATARESSGSLGRDSASKFSSRKMDNFVGKN